MEIKENDIFGRKQDLFLILQILLYGAVIVINGTNI